MIEYFIVTGVLALLAGAVITTIWRWIEDECHRFVDNISYLKRHPQVTKILHGVIRWLFVVARWSRKLDGHIGVLWHASDASDTAVCIKAEDVHPSDVPDSVMNAIRERKRYVYKVGV